MKQQMEQETRTVLVEKPKRKRHVEKLHYDSMRDIFERYYEDLERVPQPERWHVAGYLTIAYNIGVKGKTCRRCGDVLDWRTGKHDGRGLQSELFGRGKVARVCDVILANKKRLREKGGGR